MLPNMKKNADGGVTLYIQKDSPGKDKQANWLPAPNDFIYVVMRLYRAAIPDRNRGRTDGNHRSQGALLRHRGERSKPHSRR